MNSNKSCKHITPPAEMLTRILQEARKEGLSQKALAEKAGMSEIGLSQAKGRGDMRVSTLEALANAVGMTLTLVAHDPQKRAIDAIRQGTFGRGRTR